MILTQTLIDSMVDHSESESPSESCGLVSIKVETGDRLRYPMTNVHDRPRQGFEFDPQELIDTKALARSDGFLVDAAYHSHVGTGDYYMSDDDVRGCDTGLIQLVVWVAPTPQVRAYRVSSDRSAVLHEQMEVDGELMQPTKPPHGFLTNPRHPLVAWRAYCYDADAEDFFRVYDNRTTLPEELPDRVVLILQMGDQQLIDMVIGGENYVIGKQGRWQGADDESIAYEERLGRPYAVAKRGFWPDTPTFHWIRDRALRDFAFPRPGIEVGG